MGSKSCYGRCANVSLCGDQRGTTFFMLEIMSIEIKACSSLCDIIVIERDNTHALIEIKSSGAVIVVEQERLINRGK